MPTSRVKRRPLLLGEAPSAKSDPARPFSGRSGDRLRRLTDLDKFDLANLFEQHPGRSAKGKGSRWDAPAARLRAKEATPGLKGRRVVFVGRRVSTAFGYPWLPWATWTWDDRGFWAAVIPHPSGIVRFWNDPANVEQVALFLCAIYHPRDAAGD